jgi:hypothetical protein
MDNKQQKLWSFGKKLLNLPLHLTFMQEGISRSKRISAAGSTDA